jgi:hypothetical protein
MPKKKILEHKFFTKKPHDIHQPNSPTKGGGK